MGMACIMTHLGPPADEVSITPELNAMLGPDRTSKMWNLILSLKDKLLENRLCGKPYEKHRIPPFYKTRDGVDNLYYIHFSEGFRACYTLQKIPDTKKDISAVILDLMTHKEYEKRFGYSGN